jgi:hypothetical protein
MGHPDHLDNPASLHGRSSKTYQISPDPSAARQTAGPQASRHPAGIASQAATRKKSLYFQQIFSCQHPGAFSQTSLP